MRKFTKVMKALSDPNRVKIVKMLEAKSLCVCELREVLGLAQPTVSKHLKVLEDAGLVRGSKEKMWVNYALTMKGDTPYVTVLLELMRDWLNEDEDVKQAMEKVQQVNREELVARPLGVTSHK